MMVYVQVEVQTLCTFGTCINGRLFALLMTFVWIVYTDAWLAHIDVANSMRQLCSPLFDEHSITGLVPLLFATID